MSDKVIINKIMEKNKERLEILDEKIRQLEEDSFLSLASNECFVNDVIWFSDMKCDWLGVTTPTNVRLKLTTNPSLFNYNFLKKVMLDRGYRLTTNEYDDEERVFERVIDFAKEE